MKWKFLARPVFILVILMFAACSSPAPEQPAAPAPAPPKPDEAKWTATDGISAPESVWVDVASGDIYIAAILGAATLTFFLKEAESTVRKVNESI